MPEIDQIKANKPEGATHYHKNEFIVAYYFYSNDVNMWFVWVDHYKYWSSKCFTYREFELKPL